MPRRSGAILCLESIHSGGVFFLLGTSLIECVIVSCAKSGSSSDVIILNETLSVSFGSPDVLHVFSLDFAIVNSPDLVFANTCVGGANGQDQKRRCRQRNGQKFRHSILLIALLSSVRRVIRCLWLPVV